MLILLTVIHVVVCLFLIIVVLLQSGKAADLAGAFGGMGSQTAFGPRGAATLLSKSTTGAAILFMVTSITLGIMQGNRGGVAGQSVIERTGQTAGEAPAPAPVPGAGVQDLPIPAPGESSTVNVTPEAVVTPTEEAPATPPAGEAPPQQ
ncbi:MAG: preprotein translocase subunit SecG [Acidobacteria bacterium]|nr:preprotein translocase subunit SecG [Acidobacteriota bacterium]